MNKLIAANWKMNKTVAESVSTVKELKKLVKDAKNAEIAVCPPFTALYAVSKELKKSDVRLGAQNMHFEDAGALTGEVSPAMLKDIGCEFVILGHSERREFSGEDDEFISKKVIAALKHDLKPILCVGENLEQRNNGEAKDVVENQLEKCLNEINKSQMAMISIAYEPVWAISRGNSNTRPATKEDAEKMHRFIQGLIAKIFDSGTSKSTRILYGGSVKPENARELLSMPNINGALVGNASLDAKSFAEIVKAAEIN